MQRKCHHFYLPAVCRDWERLVCRFRMVVYVKVEAEVSNGRYISMGLLFSSLEILEYLLSLLLLILY